ncbi:MAG: hypothetical protein ACQ9IQ_06720 [Nitrospirales bacterium]
MKRIQYLFVVLLGLVWLLSPWSAAAGNWPTKEFKVILKNPYPTTWADVQIVKARVLVGTSTQEYADSVEARYKYEQNSKKVSPATVKEIEKWMNTVAEEYEKMGFLKPHYGDTGIFSGKEKFKVYVFPFFDAYAAYNGICSPNPKTQIRIDSVVSINPDGSLTTKAYQDIAHELFHAIQHSYDLFSKGCNVGRWIIEGTAEAVGIEMARKLYPKREPDDICQVGMRLYSRQLYTDDKNKFGDFPCKGIKGSLDYAALSFWQFLGEYLTRKGIHMATEEFSPPDFRYLRNFFNTSHAMGTPSTEYGWLDKALRRGKRYGKHQFAIFLHTAYSGFVGTFASYWKHKRRNLYPGGVGGPPAEKESKWMEWIFGKCEEITVIKDDSTTLALQIEPVAARCIKMNFDFTGRVNLTFFATGANQSVDLESLAISTDGGEKIVRRHPAEPHPDKIGKFSLEAKSGTPQYFIVTNVRRKDPESTQGIMPTFSIVPEFMSTSKAKAKKIPKPGDSDEKEELENAWASRSWKGHASQKESSPCTKPFEYSSCGPITKIDLELAPDTAQLLDEVAGPTMSLERKMRVLDAIVQKGEEQVPSDMGKALRKIRQQDGWNVRMQIPQIQPGFTGTVSNAHIRVEKAYSEDGSANGFWLAIGPGWVGSCGVPGLGYWPSSGQVSIAEFSKYSLRGTFAAKLAGEGPSCQTLPIATSISGSFTITDIRWGQPVPELSDDEILDQTIEDTNELLPGLITDEMREYIKEQARKERQKQEQSKQEKSAEKKTSVFQQCRCSCEMYTNFCASNPEAECCVSCEPMFNACKGNLKSHNASLTTEERAKEDVEIQTMRQEYEAYLESLGASGDMKVEMIKAFDDLKTVDEKRMLMMSIPRK